MAHAEGSKTGADRPRSPRTIALVGPFLAGKTSLLEAILERTGQIARTGRVGDGNTVGDASPEAREHGMSVELNIAETEFLGDRFTFIDCPGSIEFRHLASAALDVADMAVVVCEPDPKRVPALQLILRELEDRGVPHVLFLNKIDTINSRVRDILPILQPASRCPLVLRQIPIWENDIVTGFVDLALERAFVYREHKPSEIIAIPAGVRAREKDARFHMLEQLADYDDKMMETLLSDLEPPRDQVFDDLATELREGLICPVMLGSAENGNGILRLLKMLRHEAPGVERVRARLGIPDKGVAAAIVETRHTLHGGKLSIARVLSGELTDGAVVRTPGGEDRIAGMFGLPAGQVAKRAAATAGDVVALGRLEHALTGDVVASDKAAPGRLPNLEPPAPVYAIAVSIGDRKDEVKLSTALQKLVEEDAGLVTSNDPETHQLLLAGQGEMHLRVGLERLKRKFGIEVARRRRLVPYRETIRKATRVRGRHKKQSGGHGQFGDVVIEIAPEARGAGFRFAEAIVGGAVPRQFIPSVEIGVSESLKHGPLGFPVVDCAVRLVDGSFHSVDSSDMAFRQAARLAMQEGLPDCQPVLLEPIRHVEICVPSEATARINALIAQRRGQILGFDARPGWSGWDCVTAHIPDSEMDDLIVEVRSATQGVGTFTARYDHLAELTGKLADHVLQSHRQAAE